MDNPGLSRFALTHLLLSQVPDSGYDKAWEKNPSVSKNSLTP